MESHLVGKAVTMMYERECDRIGREFDKDGSKTKGNTHNSGFLDKAKRSSCQNYAGIINFARNNIHSDPIS